LKKPRGVVPHPKRERLGGSWGGHRNLGEELFIRGLKVSQGVFSPLFFGGTAQIFRKKGRRRSRDFSKLSQSLWGRIRVKSFPERGF